MSDFEKWYEEKLRDEHSEMYRQSRACVKEAYEAGRKAGLEEAAKICDPFKFDNACDRVVAREIAAVIRERIK